MITGSKHLHCPPPDGYVPDTEKVQMRTRSNSTGSDGLPIRRHHATDGSHAKRRMGLNKEQMEAMNRVSLGSAEARRPTRQDTHYTDFVQQIANLQSLALGLLVGETLIHNTIYLNASTILIIQFFKLFM
uniref:Uncharacterized protein n=1 Tax=Heliothis virescens TaxID=7102 RepID=A0A2A4IT43_HELVI